MTEGILNLNKPPGWTSSDCVAFVRGRSRVRRVGHAGTLDPAATGVLPLLMGNATRLAEYLVDATKTYEAVVLLGTETDTYDLEGDVVSEKDASRISLSEVEATLPAFRGEFLQTPPAYSALKRDGVPLYKRARRGEEVVPEPRPVRVDILDITNYAPPCLSLRLECAKGFYVRSMAHDIGAALGVGGTLASLVRTRVGSFRIEDAVELEQLRADLEAGTWQRHLYAPDEVLLGWQAAVLAGANEEHLRTGRDVRFAPEGPADSRCRAYNAAGDFLGILRREGPSWRPEKVFVT